MQDEKVYTVKEAAIILGYHETHMRKLIAEGKVGAFKKGYRTFVYQGQIDTWKEKLEKIEQIVPKVPEKVEE